MDVTNILNNTIIVMGQVVFVFALFLMMISKLDSWQDIDLSYNKKTLLITMPNNVTYDNTDTIVCGEAQEYFNGLHVDVTESQFKLNL